MNMSEAINFEQVNTILSSFVGSKGPYTLDKMRSLMDFLGNPQDKLRVIHVAGTSGKTSTCYYIAAMLQQSGKTIGLTVSPHVDQVNERLQINLVPLAESDYVKVFNEFRKLVVKSGLKPSYFEFLVAFAYWYFDKVGVDYAVVEVGLGGLLDGTNVINNKDKVCVITDIGLDHTNVLGKDLGSIAAQKAGIITSHNPVVTHQQSSVVMKEFELAARANHAQLYVAGEDDYLNAPPSFPLFQQRNWSLAKAVCLHIAKRDNLPVSADSIAETAKIKVPGRMEVHTLGKHTIIMDGAHNPQKLSALAESLRHAYPSAKFTVLLAMAGHKEQFRESLEIVTKFANHIIFTSFVVPQDEVRSSVDSHVLADICDDIGFNSYEIENDADRAYKQLIQNKNDVLLVTGSIYLVSKVRGITI